MRDGRISMTVYEIALEKTLAMTGEGSLLSVEDMSSFHPLDTIKAEIHEQNHRKRY
jgi:hypothetical protein